MQFKMVGNMIVNFIGIVEADNADDAYCKCADGNFVSVTTSEPVVDQDTMDIVEPDLDDDNE